MMMRKMNLNKRCFFIMGCMSSGTRLMGRLLVSAGCTSDGQVPAIPGDHCDLWEKEKPTADLIVMRRHSPVGRRPFWARDPNIIKALRMEGYEVFGIVMMRNQLVTEQSMIAAPHVPDLEEAVKMYRFMHRSIFQNIPEDCNYDIVNLESLVTHPDIYLKLLGERWGLDFSSSIEEVTDGNHKYWEKLMGR